MKYIPLTQGYVAVVSDKDYARCMQGYRWHVDVRKHRKTVYAIRQVYKHGKISYQKLHRFILSITDPVIKVDHRDGNGLHCNRRNLRVATTGDNQHNSRMPKHNTSGYKGVTWHKQRGKWHAQIALNRKHISLGLHSTAKAAAKAYDTAAKQLFGKFARTNF